MKQRGFTVIELLVVIGILALLTSMLLLYSRDSEKQLTLLREQAKLVNTILRAKSLSIQTFRVDGAACGYGVHIVPKYYQLFKDSKINGDCSLRASNKKFDVGEELEEKTNLYAVDIELSSNPNVTDIFFTPPDPKTTLTPNASETTITLSTNIAGEQSSVVVVVNSAGQVSSR
ncbi:MAG: prepilin-type N-terminal cleavage/methylation domain-containing protein [bacterium]|nr:prepilin-type N-terminal cleavage/methylation domain-containing protein [bacterium]